MSAATDQVAAHGYEVYSCVEPGCPWSCAWPCRGFCHGHSAVLTVPLGALAAIGAHARWHDRADVREGLVRLVWSNESGNFEEIPTGGVS